MKHLETESKSSRRDFLQGASALAAASLIAGNKAAEAQAPARAGSMKVILLGTGGPEFTLERRQGAATLVLVNGLTLLFDAGRGVLQRLFDSSEDINAVDLVFLTHLHSDHIVGLPELWITPWFMSQRKGPTYVYGPKGTRAMLDGMKQCLGSDVTQRANEFNRAEDLGYEAHEFAGERVIFSSNEVTVTSVPVDHKEGNPAFGYVIQHGGRKLVLSGDCTLSDSLIAAGQGADVVIHNVYAPSPALLKSDPNKRVVAQKLTSPEQAAEVFRLTGTKYAVYSHVILLDSTKKDLTERTRAAGYRGPLTIGDDLMTIHIGETIDIVSAG
jgi:ribonuclease Z